MADQKQKTQGPQDVEDKKQSQNYGKSGGNMGAGKSGKEGLGIEKPGDEMGQGSQKPGADGGDGAHADTQKRAHDDHTARGGGSNQSRDKGGVEMDATGGRRAKHNDDEDKYGGRGGGKRGQ